MIHSDERIKDQPLFPPETRDSKTENLFSTPWFNHFNHDDVSDDDDAPHDDDDDANLDLVSDDDDASHDDVSDDANVNHDDDGDYDDAGHPCIFGRKRIQL